MLTKGFHQNLRNALFAAVFPVCLPLGNGSAHAAPQAISNDKELNVALKNAKTSDDHRRIAAYYERRRKNCSKRKRKSKNSQITSRRTPVCTARSIRRPTRITRVSQTITTARRVSHCRGPKNINTPRNHSHPPLIDGRVRGPDDKCEANSGCPSLVVRGCVLGFSSFLLFQNNLDCHKPQPTLCGFAKAGRNTSGEDPPPFLKVLILKGDEVVCFHTDLKVCDSEGLRRRGTSGHRSVSRKAKFPDRQLKSE